MRLITNSSIVNAFIFRRKKKDKIAGYASCYQWPINSQVLQKLNFKNYNSGIIKTHFNWFEYLMLSF